MRLPILSRPVDRTPLGREPGARENPDRDRVYSSWCRGNRDCRPGEVCNPLLRNCVSVRSDPWDD